MNWRKMRELELDSRSKVKERAKERRGQCCSCVLWVPSFPTSQNQKHSLCQNILKKY